MWKKIVFLIISVIGCGIGIGITLKAGIGVAPYDAVSAEISELWSMKTGTVVIILNFILILLQWLIKKNDFKPIEFLQMVVSIVLGWSINLVLYTLLKDVNITNYLMQIGLVCIGQLICAWFIAISLELHVVSFPMESTCVAIAMKCGSTLGKIRQIADIVCVCIAVILAVVFHTSLVLREGSIISLLIFGPMLDFVKPYASGLVKNLVK